MKSCIFALAVMIPAQLAYFRIVNPTLLGGIIFGFCVYTAAMMLFDEIKRQ